MKPFDNFKLIERFRKHFKNDDFEMTFVSDEYGTITCNNKRFMSAAYFYKEYVREYGWEFCDSEAEKSPVITPEFLKLCHFYEWQERGDFEMYLTSQNAEEWFEDLKEFIPLFNESDLESFINKHFHSSTIFYETLILYGWMVEHFHWSQESLNAFENRVIEKLLKAIRSNEVLTRIRKATNGTLDLSPLEPKQEKKEPERFKLDKIGQQALSLVKKGENLFITGKAGTGKTTLLREILRQVNKKIAIVAPTGVAAKNAVGITIHSFLRLPTAPYFPGIKNAELYKLKRADEQVIKNVEIIVIDEISMVRCDLLDAMDDVLRHYRKNSEPFGGVQVVMFGDLYQLMPVAPDDEWQKLKKYYDSPYFFSSKVYQSLRCKMLELKKVYRQNETDFVTILNNIREGVASLQEIKILNTRYDEKASLKAKDSIMLTTHNRRAKGYNWDRLQKLPGEIREYKASVSGWFPYDEYPTSANLQLKVGAKVMFIKNDTIDHSYYNGMMGVITRLSGGYVEVESDNKILTVIPQYWEHQKYVINKESKKLEVEVTGSFVQLPLMLAWAVTIHKSQGLTFDNVIIDAEKAFTFGQVYVALSRCRTLKGILLTSLLSEKCIKADEVVKKFMAETTKVVLDEDDEDLQRKHLNFNNSEERTLFFINNGLGIDEIVKQCGETKAIVLSHIAKLVAKGKVNAKDYVSSTNYTIISSLLHRFGVQAERKLIRHHAPNVSFAEIEIVRASLSNKKSNRQKDVAPVSNSPVTDIKEKEPLTFEISPKTFDKIKKRKKTSYKKIIYKTVEARLFFIEDNIKLIDVSGHCPYTLKMYDSVKFISSDSSESIQRKIKSVSVEAPEVSTGKKRWVANIEFK